MKGRVKRGLLAMMGLLIFGLGVWAAVPGQIHYQGRLTDAEGAVVNGPVAMAVRLYDAASGGTLLYEEDLGNVTVVDGVYSFGFGAAGTRVVEGSEVVLTTNGVNQIFNTSVSGSVLAGTLSLSDGVYSWSQSGGSSSANFSVTYTAASQSLQVIYLAGVPEADRELVATYQTIDSLEIFATLTASEHWLALVIGGEETSPRTRLLAVPYALKARESETSADAQALAAQMALELAAIKARLDDAGIAPVGFVKVEGGTLPASSPLGAVAVSTFLIGKYEVTWGEWQTVRTYASANGYDIGSVGAGCADGHPVHTVNWYDVIKWSNAKSEMEGLTPVYTVSGNVYRTGEFGWDGSHVVEQNQSANGYRLPLEAEWEFAARGGNQTNGYTYSGSNDLNSVGWYWDNSGGAACPLSSGLGTWPVGQKAANELGLYDMSGNVWEWCWDASGSYRRIRGGSWSSSAVGCTVSFRSYFYPDNRSYSIGFRLARSSGN